MDSLALGALESIDANDALVAWELRQRRRDQSLTGTSKSGEAEESNAAAGTKDNGEGDLLNELIFTRQICTEIIVSSGDEGENNLNEGKPYIGTLLVTNQRVAWISEDYDREKTVNPLESSKGVVQIDYRALNMHAVCSQDSTVQERSCIYCQLLPKLVQYSAKGEEEEDGTVQVIFSAQESLEEEVSSQFQDAEEHGSSPKVSANNENDEDDDDEDGNAYGEEDIEETDELIEVRFVPENQTSLSELFKALSQGAALFPDEEEEDYDNEFDEENGDGGIQLLQGGLGAGWITLENADELNNIDAEALHAKLAHWDSLLVTEPGQFDDALEPQCPPGKSEP